MKHRGNRLYRFKNNPLEKVFSDAWEQENVRPNDGPGVLAWSMGDGQFPGNVTDRDATVAASVVQWLGSTVGQRFLADVLVHPDAQEFRDMVRHELETRAPEK